MHKFSGCRLSWLLQPYRACCRVIGARGRLCQPSKWLFAPLVVCLAGCVLQPHVDVPRRLQEQPVVLNCPSPDALWAGDSAACTTKFYGDLPYAIAGADELRRAYNEKMRSETALSNTVLATLIPLSAYALYRGIAHESQATEDLLLKAGLTGSAAYAGMTMFTSKPRQVLYIAGSEALGCAMLASRPYLFTASEMGSATDRGSFLGDLQFLHTRIAALEASIWNVQAVSDAAMAELTARPNPAASQSLAKPAPPARKSPDPKLSSDADLKDLASRKRLADFNAKLAAKGQQARSAPVKPQPDQTQMHEAPDLAAARACLEEARRVLGQGAALRGQIDLAGSRLRDRALQINSQVSREILKTEPNPASIFSVVSSIGQNAFRLTGAAALKPSIPVVQSKGPMIRYSLDDNEKARSALRNATDQVVAAAAAVTQWVRRVDGLAATVGGLAECHFTAPGAALKVSPNVGAVEMRPSSSMTFSVAGGSGIPKARVVGVWASENPHHKPLSIHVDPSGAYTATFTLTAEATADDRPVVVFTDGDGKLMHEVAVTVIAAGADANQGDGNSGLTKIPDKAQEPPPAQAPAIAPAPSPVVTGDCTKVNDLRRALGLAPGARDREMDQKIVACRAKLKLPPAGALLDPPLCQRLLQNEAEACR